MIVLKTIPAVPAIAEIPDSVYRVGSMKIDFVRSEVTFEVTSSYIPVYNMGSPAIAPISRTVSFAEVAPLVTAPNIGGFIAIVRNAVALAMGVTLDKVPPDIFAA